jgi:hypothetical protein
VLAAQAAQLAQQLLRRREAGERRFLLRPVMQPAEKRSGGKRRPLGLQPLDQVAPIGEGTAQRVRVGL